MSIFNLETNPPSLSNDWLIFQKFMGNIGAFTYISQNKTAYLDPVARKMLACKSEKLNEFEFFNLLEKISKNPVEDQKHIYSFTAGNHTRYIKMNIYENSNEWLGFVQDFTRQIEKSEKNRETIEFDPVTHLPSYASFSQKVKKCMTGTRQCFLGAVYINGIEKLGSFLTVDNTNNCIASVAETIQGFASPNIIIGSRSNYEIYVFFYDCDKMTVCNLLNSMDESVRNCTLTDDFGEIIDISDKSSLSLSIGCVSYPDEATDFNTLVNYSEFALYEARNSRRSVINWFSDESYVREEDSYKNAQILLNIIRNNLITYYFQPIADTHTGEIIAYEALMRTTGDTRMSPKQILRIAEEQNALYAVEKMTFFNTLRIISKNKNVFKKRKLFINCIPSHILTDDDFNELYLNYGELLEKTVVEIVEESSSTRKIINTLKKRCEFIHAQLAIDDYGTGYSNSSNLLKYAPDYIKIDRSLISDIHNDLKKQQLVTQVIDFCHENKLKSIAECVETVQEMKTVIRLGVDLVQGYYISKPRPAFLKDIPAEVRDEIINTNLESRPEGAKKIYNAQTDTEIDLLKLALEKYTDIHIYQSKLTISGDPQRQIKMNISVMDNHSCDLTLKNVNIISGNGRPSISVGEYARLSLNVVKTNRLGYAGIYVPMGSQFEMTGKGSLIIDCQSPESIGIGNDYDHSYGDIKIDMSGSLEIIANGIETICIGGGFNEDDSEINIVSGKIKIHMHTHNGLAVGSFNGDSVINISDKCSLDINCSGIRIAGIGSFRGITSVTSSADTRIFCTGAQAVGIGVLEDGDGSVIIDGGKIAMKMRSANHSCIGAVQGNVNTRTENAEISIDSEGDEVTGIGTVQGEGKVIISGSAVQMKILAGNPRDIGSDSEIQIINSTVDSLVNNKRINHKS
ncbi:MAG: GGDEF domain-containing protein [Ruminococcus flavefaciens]|nr:GGDEF domain-containing protein [Ruminococcus flavefaciens]